jgi:hypothetical protein
MSFTSSRIIAKALRELLPNTFVETLISKNSYANEVMPISS